ncbi:MAG: hypothetical protein ACOC5B_01060 [Myxococcota bacterium]
MFRTALPFFLLATLLALPAAPAGAQDAAVPRHVEELVDEVRLVVNEVKRGEGPDADAEADAEETWSCRDRGVVPFTRTVVALLWRGLPIVQEDEDGVARETPYLIQVKPRGNGGQLRWTIRF